MDSTIEAINNNTKEKVYYYIAFGFLAFQVIGSFYLLVFEIFILFFKTIASTIEDITPIESVLLSVHPFFIIFGVGGGTVASFIFGFFDKLRLAGAIIMIFLAGFCNFFILLVTGWEDGKEIVILTTALGVLFLLFMILYFKGKKRQLAM
jgi:hypothetical protein